MSQQYHTAIRGAGIYRKKALFSHMHFFNCNIVSSKGQHYDYVLNIKSSGVKFLCYINLCSYLLTFNDVRQGRLQKNMIAHKSFFQHNSK